MALWVAVANPMMVIHMVGGGHNDLLVMGLLAAGALFALRGRHVAGIALVTAAMAVKASAGVALPFLVLVWAAHLTGSQPAADRQGHRRRHRRVRGACSPLSRWPRGSDLGWLPALSAPSMIVNWMSLPDRRRRVRALAARDPLRPAEAAVHQRRADPRRRSLLLVIAVRQWWAARDGGPDAVRRAGIVLLAVAVLSPATLPWYVSWGMALLAGGPVVARGRCRGCRVLLADAGDRLLPQRRGRAVQLALPGRRARRWPRWPPCRCVRPDPLRPAAGAAADRAGPPSPTSSRMPGSRSG